MQCVREDQTVISSVAICHQTQSTSVCAHFFLATLGSSVFVCVFVCVRVCVCARAQLQRSTDGCAMKIA